MVGEQVRGERVRDREDSGDGICLSRLACTAWLPESFPHSEQSDPGHFATHWASAGLRTPCVLLYNP